MSAAEVKHERLIGDNGTLTVTVLNNGNMPTTGRLNFFLASGFKQISAGDSYSCAVLVSGQIFCWGNNESGELGDGSTTDSNVPVAVDTSGVLKNKKINTVSVGYYHTCATSEDGGVFCWGSNRVGELGNGSNIDSNVPVTVVDSGDYLKISAVGKMPYNDSTKAYFFLNDGRYARFDIPSNKMEYIASTDVGWPGITKNEAKQIIAVVKYGSWSGSKLRRKMYLFLANGQYIRYDVDSKKIDQGPLDVSQGWPGITQEEAKQIVAAVSYSSYSSYANKLIYFFFSNGRYLRYDTGSEKVVSNLIDVSKGWPGITQEQANKIIGADSSEGLVYFFLNDGTYLAYSEINEKLISTRPEDTYLGWGWGAL